MEYVFLDNSKDYYAYLLGDKLDPTAFYMAYRYFQGKPLNSSQTSDLEKIFKNRGNYMGYDEPYSPTIAEKALESWKKERNLVMKDSFAYGQEKNVDEYSSDGYGYQKNIYLDINVCPFGTFENATKLLQKKKKTLNNEELKVWIKNQDQIFLNCFEPWSNWSSSVYGNGETQTLICDDNKLQDLKTVVPINEKGGFFSWLKSLFTGGKKNIAEQPKTRESNIPLPIPYYPKFAPSGSSELQQDEEMQNALFYFYKSKRESLCSNIASDLFKKISEDLNNPHHANAILGYIRSEARDGKPIEISKINEYLVRKDLNEIRDSLQIEKEKILATKYDEEEFLKAQKGLENPGPDFIHNAAIFREQYQLFVKNHQDSLLGSADLSKHSELVRFLYYWNFDKPDSQYFSGVEIEYVKSGIKSLWLVLLLKNTDFGSKYIDTGLNINQDSKLYYPVLYYAYKDLISVNKNRAIPLVRASLSGSVPNNVYDFFSNLIMQNAITLGDAIQSMDRKPVFLKFLDSIDYGYVKSNNKSLETLLDNAGWKDTGSGDVYYYRFKNKSLETPNDDDLLTFINWGLPIDRLYADPILRQEYKEQIFVRAFLLGRKDIFIPILDELASNNAILASAKSATDESTRNFLISYSILSGLKNGGEDVYGITIHNENFNYGANYDDWAGVCNYCHDDSSFSWNDHESELQLFSESGKTNSFNGKFLSKSEIKNNLIEKGKLFNDSLVKMFSEPILAYIKINPKDGRIPDALALLIQRMRRWHYRDSDGDWTQKVFQTLKYKYPNSTGAKETTVYW